MIINVIIFLHKSSQCRAGAKNTDGCAASWDGKGTILFFSGLDGEQVGDGILQVFEYPWKMCGIGMT
jgi:hypothetical protein